jgi:protein TonB
MRPLSQTAFASPTRTAHTRGASSHRIIGITVAVAVQLTFGYALVSGFKHQMFIDLPHHLSISMLAPDVKPADPPPPPPNFASQPPPQLFTPPVLELPPYTADTPQDGGLTITANGYSGGISALPPAVPDRGPAVIAATHTKPPYPPVSRRLGEEGMVRLAITVAADGSVAQAVVAASSGHARLDQAAVDWVKAHWRYQPAISGGKPAVSTIAAMVTFELQ